MVSTRAVNTHPRAHPCMHTHRHTRTHWRARGDIRAVRSCADARVGRYANLTFEY